MSDCLIWSGTSPSRKASTSAAVISCAPVCGVAGTGGWAPSRFLIASSGAWATTLKAINAINANAIVFFTNPLLISVCHCLGTEVILGYSQYHLAVAGGYVVDTLECCACTHPLPRGGTDCIQVSLAAKSSLSFNRQRNVRGVLAGAKDFLRCRLKVSVSRLENVRYKLLRVSIDNRKPGALHLHHNTVALLESMFVGRKSDLVLINRVCDERFGLL